jgi:hypothetical protein
MLPIVTKSFNSSGQSDYDNGFVPDLLVEEGIYLMPLGDPNEPLLSAALARLSSSSGRLSIPETANPFGERLDTSTAMRERAVRQLILDDVPDQ